jgi:hypothetical protein
MTHLKVVKKNLILTFCNLNNFEALFFIIEVILFSNFMLKDKIFLSEFFLK